MHRHKYSNQNSQTNLLKYEIYKTEPKIPRDYHDNILLDDEVVDNGYLLKMRVRRNMRKIRHSSGLPSHGRINLSHFHINHNRSM